MMPSKEDCYLFLDRPNLSTPLPMYIHTSSFEISRMRLLLRLADNNDVALDPGYKIRIVVTMRSDYVWRGIEFTTILEILDDIDSSLPKKWIEIAQGHQLMIIDMGSIINNQVEFHISLPGMSESSLEFQIHPSSASHDLFSVFWIIDLLEEGVNFLFLG